MAFTVPAVSTRLRRLQSFITQNPVVSAVAEARSGDIVVGTHSGTFHCDEVLGCALLQNLPKYNKISIVRTRNPAELVKCHLVMDVGAIYDHKTKRYDHHQREFSDVMSEIGFKTKLSSSGLIYRHYGREIIQAFAAEAKVELDSELLEDIYARLYGGFIEHVDAIDNGISVGEDLKYSISTTLSSRVGNFNPKWNNKDVSSAVRNAQFKKAMLVCADEFASKVEHLLLEWLPARSIVAKAYAERTAVHGSGQILQLQGYCPWASHLYDLEVKAREGKQTPPPLVMYVVFPDSGGSYRVQAVAEAPGSFVSRKALPAPWRGIRDDKLSLLSDIPDCIFVHAAGFIGGNKTLKGAMQMAEEALRYEDDTPDQKRVKKE